MSQIICRYNGCLADGAVAYWSGQEKSFWVQLLSLFLPLSVSSHQLGATTGSSKPLILGLALPLIKGEVGNPWSITWRSKPQLRLPVTPVGSLQTPKLHTSSPTGFLSFSCVWCLISFFCLPLSFSLYAVCLCLSLSSHCPLSSLITWVKHKHILQLTKLD